MHKTKVLVVGDVMVDRYVYGNVDRISPEAPVPVMNVTYESSTGGGAANLAANCAAFGLETELLGIIGNDEAGDFLKNFCISHGINSNLVQNSSVTTTLKTRLVSETHQMFRVDRETTHDASLQHELLERFDKQIEDADVVILSDYDKGTLQDLKPIIAKSRKYGVPVLVDPKKLDFENYRGCSLIKPNLKEFKSAMNINGDIEINQIEELARTAIKNFNFDSMLITMGARGAVFINREGKSILTQAKKVEVFDVSGAGDTVLAAFCYGMSKSYKAEYIINLCNAAAGLVIRKFGTAVLSKEETETLYKQHSGYSSYYQLTLKDVLIKLGNTKGKIVFTNGVFDVLHTGHLHLLRQAKALGDYLVVAVNSDVSTKRLNKKHIDRPINNEYDRATLISALECVDFVFIFSDNTPIKAIMAIKPDILVKGGDYSANEIVGSDFVINNGGSVEIVDLHDQKSTTKIIEKIGGFKR
jgi:D-beta-D-heptose 7-phosphate kinase / D-beta-D-heptose 1-phosphate adenosyltransferase